MRLTKEYDATAFPQDVRWAIGGMGAVRVMWKRVTLESGHLVALTEMDEVEMAFQSPLDIVAEGRRVKLRFAVVGRSRGRAGRRQRPTYSLHQCQIKTTGGGAQLPSGPGHGHKSYCCQDVQSTPGML